MSALDDIQGAEAESAAPSAAFEFVKLLATDVSAGRVELPSFPDIALRVQKVLADPNVSQDQVVRVLGSDPSLAARILSTANSAALNPGGRQIVELRIAVARMGFDMIRSAAMAFAMSQLRRADQYKAIARSMGLLWQRSVLVAAYCFVIAKRFTRVSPDLALLAGVLHCVGRLYILTRAVSHPQLFHDQSVYNVIVHDWHANIAKALLENWGMADELVDAVATQDEADRDVRGTARLADVLLISTVLASFQDQPELTQLKLQECKTAKKLGIDYSALETLKRESESELRALHEVLGE